MIKSLSSSLVISAWSGRQGIAWEKSLNTSRLLYCFLPFYHVVTVLLRVCRPENFMCSLFLLNSSVAKNSVGSCNHQKDLNNRSPMHTAIFKLFSPVVNPLVNRSILLYQ